eukprot:scaffold295_cov257-Pinguiococcus_pyrenoidosus.AAC.16
MEHPNLRRHLDEDEVAPPPPLYPFIVFASALGTSESLLMEERKLLAIVRTALTSRRASASSMLTACGLELSEMPFHACPLRAFFHGSQSPKVESRGRKSHFRLDGQRRTDPTTHPSSIFAALSAT